jgi:hypothetical protein
MNTVSLFNLNASQPARYYEQNSARVTRFAGAEKQPTQPLAMTPVTSATTGLKLNVNA